MSKKGHIPIRMCIGCRKRRKQEEMLRFTLQLNGGVVMNEKNHRIGRGFYLCPELVCLKMARKKIVGLDLWTQKSSIFLRK